MDITLLLWGNLSLFARATDSKIADVVYVFTTA